MLVFDVPPISPPVEVPPTPSQPTCQPIRYLLAEVSAPSTSVEEEEEWDVFGHVTAWNDAFGSQFKHRTVAVAVKQTSKSFFVFHPMYFVGVASIFIYIIMARHWGWKHQFIYGLIWQKLGEDVNEIATAMELYGTVPTFSNGTMHVRLPSSLTLN